MSAAAPLHRLLAEMPRSHPRTTVIADVLRDLELTVTEPKYRGTPGTYLSPGGAWRPLDNAPYDVELASAVMLGLVPEASAHVEINGCGVSVNIDAHGVRGLGARADGDQALAIWQALANLLDQLHSTAAAA